MVRQKKINLPSIFLIAVVGFFILAVYVMKPRSYYSHDHPILNKVRDNFSILNPEYARIPLQKGDSAFTENKRMITLCLADPTTKQYYDMNTIMYVALHELAHVVSKTHGHNGEFKDNFAELLKQASVAGIYDPVKPIPLTYCGSKD